MGYTGSTSCYLISKCAQILFISVAFLNIYYLIYCSFPSLLFNGFKILSPALYIARFFLNLINNIMSSCMYYIYILGYLKDSNAAAQSVDSDIF